MKVIGLVGGVAAGKSFVAELFRQLGADVIDADRVGHEVLLEPAVVDLLRARWGSRVLNTAGELDRAAIARIVFEKSPAGAAELAFLEGVTHPRIRARIEQQLAVWRAAGHPAAILDAAVLLKSNWHRICDDIVFVDASPAARLRRARQRGWTAETLAQREAAQESLDEKRRHATYTIDNSGERDVTLLQVQQLWRRLGLPAATSP